MYVVEQTFCLHHLVRNVVLLNALKYLFFFIWNPDNLSNPLQKRTRMSIILHLKSVFHTCFGVNLIIGSVLLTLAILTLQHQPTGR